MPIQSTFNLKDFRVDQPSLSPLGVDHVLEALKMERPARRVGDNVGKNICGTFLSIKNGRQIWVESLQERLFCLSLEYDDSVIGYLEQPMKLGRFYPDFLVVFRDGRVSLVEVKHKSWLKKKVRMKGPWKHDPVKGYYQQDLWAMAQEIGLPIQLYYNDENAISLINQEILYSCRLGRHLGHRPTSEIPKAILPESIRRALMEGALSLTEALQLEKNTTLSELVRCIDEGLIAANTHVAPITSPENLMIGLTTADLEGVIPDDLANRSIHLGILSAQIQPFRASQEDGERFLRYKTGNMSQSQIYRLAKREKAGQNTAISAIELTRARNERKGNRTPKRNPEVLRLLRRFIERQVKKNEPLDSVDLYTRYSNTHNRKFKGQEEPVAPPTFRENLKKLVDAETRAYLYGGRRAKNSVTPSLPPGKRRPPVPLVFLESSIDNWKMDLSFAYGSASGKHAIRPVLSILIDHTSKAILAWTISARPGSRQNIMLLLRRCVEQWGLLPLSIWSDRAGEYFSQVMRDFCANYGVSHMVRPPEDSRFGSQVEKVFDSLRRNWARGKDGFHDGLDKSRKKSSTHWASNTASLSLEAFILSFEVEVERYNRRILGRSGQVPLDLMRDQLSKYDFLGIKVNDDYRFRVNTSIDVNTSSDRKLVVGRQGMHHLDAHYQADELRSLVGKRLLCRSDPDDCYTLYVKTDNGWIPARASGRELGLARTQHQIIANRLWINDCRGLARKIRLADLAESRRWQLEAIRISQEFLIDERARRDDARRTTDGIYPEIRDFDTGQIIQKTGFDAIGKNHAGEGKES